MSNGDNYSSVALQKLTTRLTAEQLVVPREVREELENIETWLRTGRSMERDTGLARYVMPGYRTLFWGPPGTGKTLAAGLLGQSLGLDVYRVDLSRVVSKWIGETEKNLARIFDEGERNEWILFFDEADALFGRRTSVATPNDRNANREVALLVQRMETYPGVTILSSNLKANLDDAFARRIQSFVHFPMPSATLRAKLWRQMLGTTPCAGVDLDALAEEYEMSGGSIANALRGAMLIAASEEREMLTQADLLHGISRELRRGGKVGTTANRSAAEDGESDR